MEPAAQSIKIIQAMDNKQNTISSFSVIIVFAALILIGISLIPLINFQLEPSRSLPTLSVSYNWSNASSKVIEQEVTSKLEGVFNSIHGVKEIQSVSRKGGGTINLNFKKNSNMDVIRFEVATLIRRIYAEFPEQVSYPSISLRAGGKNTGPILTYTISANASPYFIQKYADNNIVPKLAGIKGVNEVNVYGATAFEWEIRFDADILSSLNIEIQDLRTGIGNCFRKEIVGVGFVEDAGEASLKRIRLSIQNDMPEELDWSRIPIKKIGDRVIYLTDVATISHQEKTPGSYFRINGLNTINMVVYPDEGINTIRLAEDVGSAVKIIRTMLPKGYSINLVRNSSDFIAKELRKIGIRTIFSMLILLIFVLLITRSFRYLWLITLSLFANLIIAVIFYYLLKIEIHLYSLAGITVSFGILIDNSIIMIDHLRHHNNRKAFLAILAATLTTIGSLSIIIFLKEQQRINLVDFALVIIVNLTVSILIALFFIPALMDKLPLEVNSKRFYMKRKKKVLRLNKIYTRSIVLSRRFKWVFITLIILGFGLPIHRLPSKVKKDGFFPSVYNKTIGSEWYQEDAKPVFEKVLGGSLRLFTENVFNNSSYSDPQQTKLYVRGKMPEGCSVQQLNVAIRKMENYISSYDEVELFQTSIGNSQNSSITIHFKPEFENGSFPYFLKEQLTSKAIGLGGLDWNIYGVGRGFSNELYSGYKNSRIVLEGYNYDQLYGYANDLKEQLLKNVRIQEVSINGGNNYGSSQALTEYFIDFDREQFGLNEISLNGFYSFLSSRVYKQSLPPIFYDEENQQVTLVSSQEATFNVWDLNNVPIQIDNKIRKLSELASIEKRKSGTEIHKHNQQYRLTVAYDFLGPVRMSKSVKKEYIAEMNEYLPLGYLAKSSYHGGWDKDNKKQYYLLFLVIVIIFFLCSILFESLVQPIVIILMIPISYIGVFLTFYLFDFNFDQGGFASFILLSGIVVNSGLYIINEYNQLKKVEFSKGHLQLYLKAFNHKIVPIFLTIISTVLGLIPFVWLGQNEAFWFAFAVGAMGGLLFSFVALIFYLPMFMRFKEN